MQAISRNLAKFYNAAMEKFDRKAVEHNLIRGSLNHPLVYFLPIRFLIASITTSDDVAFTVISKPSFS